MQGATAVIAKIVRSFNAKNIDSTNNLISRLDSSKKLQNNVTNRDSGYTITDSYDTKRMMDTLSTQVDVKRATKPDKNTKKGI